MSDKSRLKAGEFDLLSKVIWQRNPSLMPLVHSLGKAPLTQEEREQLRDVLADEFVEHGLQPDDEPNEWGVKVDDLIGRLMDF